MIATLQDLVKSVWRRRCNTYAKHASFRVVSRPSFLSAKRSNISLLFLSLISVALLAMIGTANAETELSEASRVKRDRRYCARMQDTEQIRVIADKVCALALQLGLL